MVASVSSSSMGASLPASDTRVVALLQQACERYPERLAIEDGERRYTFAELRDEAHALHAELARILPGGGVVAVIGHRSAEVIAAACAVWLSGCTLMLMDDALPAQRQDLMTELQPPAAIIDCQQRGSVTVRATGSPAMGWSGDEGSVPSKADCAYVAFTSGSTGRPKAILGSQAGLSHFLQWQRDAFGIGPQDRFAHLTNISFDVWFRDAFTPLISGSTLCIPPSRQLGAAEMFEWLQAQAITALHVVPSIANHWMNHAGSKAPNAHLRLAFFAGEPLEGVLVRRWARVFTACQVVNLYGPTETTLAKLFKRLPAQVQDGVQPVGLPLPGAQAYILDEQLAPCDDGVQGEICIATDYRSHGYLDQQHLMPTFVRWTPPGCEPCWIYRTGDYGLRRADGDVEILGRKDDQVKINGVRIELLEIKSLIASWPSVRDVFVCTVSQPQGVGIVAVVEGEPSVAAELVHMLRQRLPAVMVPSRILVESVLPRLPNGKLDRAATRVLAARAPAPLASPVEAASDELPDQLAAIWQELLGLGSIERTSNFFELGGNSLTIVELHARLEHRFQVRFALVRLFEHASVAAQAALLTQLLGLTGSHERLVPQDDTVRRHLRSRAISARQRVTRQTGSDDSKIQTGLIKNDEF